MTNTVQDCAVCLYGEILAEGRIRSGGDCDFALRTCEC